MVTKFKVQPIGPRDRAWNCTLMTLRTLVSPSPTAEPASELDESILTAAGASAPTMLATAARRSSSVGFTHCEYISRHVSTPSRP